MSRLADDIDDIIRKLQYLKDFGLPDSEERRHAETLAQNSVFRETINQLHLELKGARAEIARLGYTYGELLRDIEKAKP